MFTFFVKKFQVKDDLVRAKCVSLQQKGKIGIITNARTSKTNYKIPKIAKTIRIYRKVTNVDLCTLFKGGHNFIDCP